MTREDEIWELEKMYRLHAVYPCVKRRHRSSVKDDVIAILNFVIITAIAIRDALAAEDDQTTS